MLSYTICIVFIPNQPFMEAALLLVLYASWMAVGMAGAMSANR